MLLDTHLDAPGLRRMKMETRTVDGPEGARPAVPKAHGIRCSRSKGAPNMAARSCMAVAGACLIRMPHSES